MQAALDYVVRYVLSFSPQLIFLCGMTIEISMRSKNVRTRKALSRRMTLSSEEDLVRFARQEAKREGSSLSGFFAGILRERMSDSRRDADSYEDAMRRALARKPFLKGDGRYSLARKFMTARRGGAKYT